MPELPEVETIVSDLRPRLIGKRITGVRLLWPGAVAHPSSEGFAAHLAGRTIGEISRRAKYITIPLDADAFLVVHLRMTGRLLYEPLAVGELPQHTRAVLALEGDHQLRFSDPRKLGRLYLFSQEEHARLLGALGPELLAEDFTAQAFAALLKNRRARIKPLLLNQRLLAGVGNIYADEALFVAGLHPMRRASELSAQELGALYEGLRQVLREGIADRGTTISAYRDAFGQRGAHQHRLRAYRRQGKPCLRCGAPIQKLSIGNRGSYFCPACQRL